MGWWEGKGESFGTGEEKRRVTRGDQPVVGHSSTTTIRRSSNYIGTRHSIEFPDAWFVSILRVKTGMKGVLWLIEVGDTWVPIHGLDCAYNDDGSKRQRILISSFQVPF